MLEIIPFVAIIGLVVFFSLDLIASILKFRKRRDKKYIVFGILDFILVSSFIFYLIKTYIQ